jgi:hypothetical protein
MSPSFSSTILPTKRLRADNLMHGIVANHSACVEAHGRGWPADSGGEVAALQSRCLLAQHALKRAATMAGLTRRLTLKLPIATSCCGLLVAIHSLWQLPPCCYCPLFFAVLAGSTA